MKQNVIIQKIVAAALLLIFSISATPKTYFHDLIANHKDVYSCKQLHRSPVLHQQGYNCHFDELVVTAPFFPQTEQTFAFLNVQFEKRQVIFYISSLQEAFRYKENRGPPSVA